MCAIARTRAKLHGRSVQNRSQRCGRDLDVFPEQERQLVVDLSSFYHRWSLQPSEDGPSKTWPEQLRPSSTLGFGVWAEG